MGDSRTPTRKTAARRGRKVQTTFAALLVPPDDNEPQDFPALDFKTFPYRTALANWPDEWRERWGRRANELEEQGLDWQEAESRAFFQVQEERRAEGAIRSIPLIRPGVERN